MVSAEDKFLQQLMAENEVQLKRKDSLDTRSFTMITISATSSALLIAVAVALLDKISSHYVFLDDIIIFLVIGIMLTVVSIMFFISSSRARDYRYGFAHNIFLDERGFKVDTINQYRQATERELNELLIRVYLECTKENTEINLRRENRIFVGQWVYLTDIVVILVSIGLQLHAVLLHAVG